MRVLVVMNAMTIPAPIQNNAGSCVVPGTIGFDLYLSVLGFSSVVLKPARVPS